MSMLRACKSALRKTRLGNWNEWDPLKEVIVGTPKNARVPHLNVEVIGCTGIKNAGFYEKYGGQLYPKEIREAAQKEVDNLAETLAKRGIKVHRPDDPLDFCDEARSINYQYAMPRDIITVVGNSLVISSMGFRDREDEHMLYKRITTQLFREGADIVYAPRSTFNNSCYRDDYPHDTESIGVAVKNGAFAIKEQEPMFDAADFYRVGNVMLGQLSHVTNLLGIKWMRDFLKSKNVKLAMVDFIDPHALHMDSTWFPIGPGLILACPDRPCLQQEYFDKCGWRTIHIPRPAVHEYKPDWHSPGSSAWVTNLNVLLIDPETIVVQQQDVRTMEFFKSHGFNTIPLPMLNANLLAGGFHCWTTDLVRGNHQEVSEPPDYFDGGLDDLVEATNHRIAAVETDYL